MITLPIEVSAHEVIQRHVHPKFEQVKMAGDVVLGHRVVRCHASMSACTIETIAMFLSKFAKGRAIITLCTTIISVHG